MGVRILVNDTYTIAAMYCSTTDVAFGPVFTGNGEHYADERIEAFLKWLPKDARSYPESELMLKYSEWLKHEEENDNEN